MINKIKINNFKQINQELTIDISSNLQFNLLFGKNESGKSTITELLKYFEIIFKRGFIGFKENVDDQSNIVFELEILKKKYVYEVTLDFHRKEVVKEVLSVNKTNELHVLYSRLNNEVSLSQSFEKLFDAFDFMRLQTYIYDLKYDRKHLVLTNIFNKEFFESKGTKFLFLIGDNLSHLNYIDLDNDFTFFSANEMSYYPKVISSLSSIYPKIKSLSYKEISLDDLRFKLNRHYYDYFIDLYRNEMMYSDKDTLFALCFKNFYKLTGKTLEDLRIYEILVEIDDKKYNLNEIGSGLRRLILLFIILLKKKKENIYLIENFNQNLDYHTMKSFIEILKADFKDKQNILISPVHDYMLFDNKLFNLNELSYVYYRYGIQIKYLNELNIRKDKKIINLLIDDSIETLL